MKNLLIIAFSNLEKDPRVNRQIMYLRRFYHITTVGWEPPRIEGVEFHPLKPIRRSRLNRIIRAVEYKLHRFEKIYWSLYDFQPLVEIVKQKHFDLVIANDIETLPFALAVGRDAKRLLDAHDYTPRSFEDVWTWRFFFQKFNRYLCGTYIKKCDRVITVSPGLAKEFKREYGITCDVITNASDYVELAPTPVDGEHIRLIHHGVANPNRQLELMIEIMDYLDKRYRLDIMVISNFPRYYRRLQAMAAKRENVAFRPPVAREEIIPATNAYDLSFLIRKPTNVNFRYGLWNKFFESLQARLGIVTGPAPETQAEIVTEYGCGIVLDSFEPKRIAAQLNRLDAGQIREFKNKADIAAREFTAQKNMEKLGEMIKEMIER